MVFLSFNVSESIDLSGVIFIDEMCLLWNSQGLTVILAALRQRRVR